MLNDKPNYIYKFVPFNLNTLKSLIKNELWFGKPINLNDPFECDFKLKFSGVLPNDNFLKKYYIEKLEIRDAIIERIARNKVNIDFFLEDIRSAILKSAIDNVGICSFSKNYNDIKMWAHYADSHKGICMVFDKDLLIGSLQNVKLEEVKYLNNLIEIEIVGFENDIQLSVPKIDDIVNLKNSCWEIEDELRLFINFFNKNSRRLFPYNPKSLKGIIIGQKMESDDVATLYHLLKDNKDMFWAKSVKKLNSFNLDFVYTYPSIHSTYNYVTY
ncbi:DUF2971 domain-containing protein [Flavobacterium seoulense]|uniref:DUF2971 domain-containing protein n=1 Tax=Flavobacterium seoulense TaxID=1492738 RepID=A0A066WTZ6_9FLAO|nr:DUF2971 domain-containing protein [Flavobacterium seoulense]KDN54419.1 hypothetical protein FEM21_23810 [Flavobacterium seoulense]